MDPRLKDLRVRSWKLRPRIAALLSATKIETIEAVYKNITSCEDWKDTLYLIEELFPEETFIWRLEQ